MRFPRSSFPMRLSSSQWLSASVFLFLLLSQLVVVDSSISVECTTNDFCEATLQKGSQCVDGLCTNPFYHGGCLKSVLPDWTKARVCNSQDPPDAELMGFCRPSPFDYAEVRLAVRDWESSNFFSWVLQILLSEVLGVPTSIEAGVEDVHLNLYHINADFDLSNLVLDPYYKEAGVAARVKDCRTVTTGNKYEACFHVLPESWYEDFPKGTVFEGIEPVRDLGVLGETSWFIPRFAAEQDPTLVSFHGLVGEDNRRKVVETFKRPTRWGQFCEEVSPTNCTKPDPIAQRPPQNEEEANSFFVEGGLYNGHFRITDQGNCDLNPTTCTGVFIDYPCYWGSIAQPQAYHMGIAFSFEGPDANGGYSYTEAAQIYAAANATKSPVAMVWWSPEPLYQSYIGTEAEFTRVLFETPTQECVDHRYDYNLLCEEGLSLEEKMGDPRGICDSYPQMLRKVISLGLRDIAMDPTVPEEFWSPAYDVISNFRMDNLQLDQIFEYWSQRDTDKWSFDPRDAVCQWVAENLDILTGFVPQSHPRVVLEVTSYGEALFGVAMSFAVLALVLVTGSMVGTFMKRKTKVFYYTQNAFLSLVLLGMGLVASGALTMAVSPSDWTCRLIQWLVNLGYVLQLVPLVMRMAAVNQLATAGNKMRRVRLPAVKLFLYVAGVGTLVGGYLLVWMLVDAPEKTYNYELTDTVTADGETVVNANDYCGSENPVWFYLSFAWQLLILLPGCMIGVMTTRFKSVNDTKSMSYLVYCHFFFLILVIITFALMYGSDGSNSSDFMGYKSLLLSLDTILSFGIYILPKFVSSGETIDAEPLPDVFVHTTICIIDVVGFSAWTSVREPVAVFQFLEQLYSELFDKIAERHGVYKVETSGECYIAATGVPDPQRDHPVLMARFALECMRKTPKFLGNKIVQFGPDTNELSLRIALHSGPVTGGHISKGNNFQLFGDTMATVKLIHTSGKERCIHLSEETAELLRKSGKSKWIAARDDKVRTAEKGELQTFWLVKKRRADIDDQSSYGGSTTIYDDDGDGYDELHDQERWIEWNVEVFKGLLKQIVARRSVSQLRGSGELYNLDEVDGTVMPLEEVKEIIELPKFDKKAARRQIENQDVEIPENVLEELRVFIKEVADRYPANPFHNFCHASSVVLAIQKYMNRIIAATEVDLGDNEERFRTSVQAALHDHTYGITSDPLTQFAVVFSALIHDVQHPGVPNPLLIEENKELALRYKNRSVAEQQSLDIAWNLLMEDRFSELRATICHNCEEMRRFRQLVVNAVMATDLGDKLLKELRNGRWEKAFAKGDSSGNSTTTSADNTMSDAASVRSSSRGDSESLGEKKSDAINRKATIVIEHLIQAADVAHMSQHWSIYRKWNERLFREMYKAYIEGRAASNPGTTWYRGELGFFDFYIIPLSQKLRDCGVFGPTSDENLNYAKNNRNMWEREGEAIVKEYLRRAELEFGTERVLHDEAPEAALNLTSDPSKGNPSVKLEK